MSLAAILNKHAPIPEPSLQKRLQAIRGISIGRRPVATPAPATLPHRPWLTDRELEVIKLIATDHSGKQAAALLGVSLKTIEKHRQNAMDKTGAHTAIALTHWAIANGHVAVIFAANEAKELPVAASNGSGSGPTPQSPARSVPN